jgi:hypothetical protein
LDMNLMMDISTFNICPEHISKSFARLAWSRVKDECKNSNTT